VVIVAEIKAEPGSATAAAIRDAGGHAVFIQTDVREIASVDAMVARAMEAYGRLDILVANAAIYDGLRMTTLERLTPGEWDEVLAVNVRGLWNCARAVAPVMRHQGGGRIIALGSSSALAGTPHMLHYVASKGAIAAMTRAMAVELGPDGITVNALVPGLTASGARKIVDLPDGTPRPAVRTALDRPVTPDELARAIVFLAGDDSASMTGQELIVNAGSAFG
jgi:NAD(P)-dependent dehydrogenase (short-subunit alcohol dehydrogenase family)